MESEETLTRALNSPSEPAVKYWAFISYSHRDDKWGRWLHRSLEGYRVPKGLVGQLGTDGVEIPARLFPIFRDREELAGGASLSAPIEQALAESRYLVVICSPHSAASKWVNEEIKAFKAFGREGRVLALIVAGEPNASESNSEECFPPALRFRVDSHRQVLAVPCEPIAADLREGKDGKRAALVKLIAGLLEVRYDSLWQREQQRRIRRLTGFAAALALLAAFFSGLATYAYRQQLLAEERARIAQSRQLSALVSPQIAVDLPRALLLGAAAHRSATTLEARSSLATVFRHAPSLVKILGHETLVNSIDIAPSGKTLAAGTYSSAILWDVATGEQIRTLNGPAGGMSAIAFSPDGRQIVSGGTGSTTLTIWDVENGQQLQQLTAPAATRYVALSKNGSMLASAASENSIALWDMASGRQVRELQGDGSVVDDVTFSPDGATLAAAQWNGKIGLWNVYSGEKYSALKGHEREVLDVAFSPDGKMLASASADGRVILWDTSGRQIAHMDGNQGPVHSVAFSPDGKTIAAGADKVILWEIASRKEITQLKGIERARIESVAFFPDGITIASTSGIPNISSVSKDFSVHLWNLSGINKPFTSLGKHAGHVNSVAFSADSSLLASASGDSNVDSKDGSVIVWNVASGEQAARFGGRAGGSHVATFSPDGQVLAVASGEDLLTFPQVVSSEPYYGP